MRVFPEPLFGDDIKEGGDGAGEEERINLSV